MKIKIVFAYHNYLNLYGEQGNIKAFAHYLDKQGIDHEIIEHHLNTPLPLEDADILYFASGIEEHLEVVYEQLKDQRDDLVKYLNKNKMLVATGNSSILFSKQYLDLCDYGIEKGKRTVFEGLFHSSINDQQIIGFVNSETVMVANDAPFKLLRTNTPNITYKADGYYKDNVLISNLIGPLFIRNPHLLSSLMEKYLRQIDPGFEPVKIDYSLEDTALKVFIDNYYQKEETK
jgi:CobQ-like glutamine amidotransferase family enzyme